MKMISKIIKLVKKKSVSRKKFALKLGVKIGENTRIATYKWGSEPYLLWHVTEILGFEWPVLKAD